MDVESLLEELSLVGSNSKTLVAERAPDGECTFMVKIVPSPPTSRRQLARKRTNVSGVGGSTERTFPNLSRTPSPSVIPKPPTSSNIPNNNFGFTHRPIVNYGNKSANSDYNSASSESNYSFNSFSNSHSCPSNASSTLGYRRSPSPSINSAKRQFGPSGHRNGRSFAKVVEFFYLISFNHTNCHVFCCIQNGRR